METSVLRESTPNSILISMANLVFIASFAVKRELVVSNLQLELRPIFKVVLGFALRKISVLCKGGTSIDYAILLMGLFFTSTRC